MAEKKAAKAGKAPAKKSSGKVFTAEEKAAMKEYVRERSRGSENGEEDVLAAIAKMPPPDRRMAERLHALIKAAAPTLAPKTWYGMPAYARDGAVVCFFQAAVKFKARYGLLGFSDKAKLDDGTMWPTSYALADLTPADEARITALVKKAVG